MSLSNHVDNEAARRSYNFQLVENVDNTSSTIPWPKHRSLTAKYDNKNTIPLTANRQPVFRNGQEHYDETCHEHTCLACLRTNA